MEKTNRNYSLDFLKILAAIGIVFHHFQATTGAQYDYFINFHGGWFNWGYLVELFFIISGYFMYRYIPVIQEGKVTLLDFWKKRALRLLPMAAISVIVFEIILLIHNTVHGSNLWGMEVSLWGTVIAALGVQEGWVFLNPVINNSIWYISVLLLCYILFYIVTALAVKIKCKPIYFYIAIILLGIGIGVYGIDWPFLNWQVARGYYAFFFGVIFGAYVARYKIRLREVIVSLITLTVVILAFVFYPQCAEDYTNYISTFLLFPSIIILFETKPVQKIFCHKIWETLSAISFEVYLWHLPMMLLMYLLMKALNWQPNFANLASMIIFMLATWVVATIMYFLLERPIAKFISQGGSRKKKKIKASQNFQDPQDPKNSQKGEITE